MNIRSFVANMKNRTADNDHRIHFYVPTINLEVEYGHDALGKKDMTTFYDKDTVEELITIPSNIKEISTWDQWKKQLTISQHSPVYRLIKAIFDGKIDPKKDPEDEYGTKYVVGPLTGYEIL